MNGAYLGNAGVFLVQTLFGLYILALMLRFLLQWARADFYNPLVQLLVKLTNPPLLPLRRIIPGLFGLDIAAVALMLIIKLVEWSLVYAIVGQSSSLAGLIVIALADLLNLLVNVWFWSILIRAVMSWFNPDYRQPVVTLIFQLTEPILRPAQRLIPPFSGLDLSPILVLLLLQLTKMLLIAPLWDTGRQLL
ncbi:MAG: YggT family protein [Candidatus Competibacteraceae bacterium]|nr:YggT family protein [Candidatus Competibacteraceae bacterium]MCB1804611.1 YggT family protein [Candidatus Competibacteraceae bacterium]MCB1810593.1 YggT family protein [Candidatus Competibacteraceae bacterium]